MEWYTFSVPVNREASMADRLRRRVQLERCAELFGQTVVPEEVIDAPSRPGRPRLVRRNRRPGTLYVQLSDCPLAWRVVGDALRDNLTAVSLSLPEEIRALGDQLPGLSGAEPRITIGFRPDAAP